MTELAQLMARHGLSILDVAKINGVTEKTASKWLDDETSKRKPCPTPAMRLMLIVLGEARADDYRP